MIVIFIVISNEVLKCYVSTQIGIRLCEPGSAVELIRLWQLGLAEVAFEGVLGGVLLKVWRKVMDKSKLLRTDREDRIFDDHEK